jgi:hypothetical protein
LGLTIVVKRASYFAIRRVLLSFFLRSVVDAIRYDLFDEILFLSGLLALVALPLDSFFTV